mmetsp:Transcript_32780/g.43713  ORF Transcript_32780/g.43713 Transcript_32780/m.43713 type:complete len:133 (-) Transcript_32780:3-401(-)
MDCQQRMLQMRRWILYERMECRGWVIRKRWKLGLSIDFDVIFSVGYFAVTFVTSSFWGYILDNYICTIFNLSRSKSGGKQIQFGLCSPVTMYVWIFLPRKFFFHGQNLSVPSYQSYKKRSICAIYCRTILSI